MSYLKILLYSTSALPRLEKIIMNNHWRIMIYGYSYIDIDNLYYVQLCI